MEELEQSSAVWQTLCLHLSHRKVELLFPFIGRTGHNVSSDFGCWMFKNQWRLSIVICVIWIGRNPHENHDKNNYICELYQWTVRCYCFQRRWFYLRQHLILYSIVGEISITLFEHMEWLRGQKMRHCSWPTCMYVFVCSGERESTQETRHSNHAARHTHNHFFLETVAADFIRVVC